MSDQLIAEQLLRAAKAVEKQVDAEIERLENLDDEGLEEIRRNRITQMKEAARKRQVSSLFDIVIYRHMKVYYYTFHISISCISQSSYVNRFSGTRSKWTWKSSGIS